MKTRALSLLFALIIILPPASNGQVGNLLKNRLNKAINAGAKTTEKEIINEVDTINQVGIDNSGDQSSGANANEKSNQVNQREPGAGLGRLFGNKVDLKYKEEYAFTSRIYMVTETYDNKDVLKMDLFMYYSSASPVVGIETKTISDKNGDAAPVTAVMVMDGENKTFLVLSDINGMKMGMISDISDDNDSQTQPNGKPAIKTIPPTFTKTGNTREIAGYKCDEYNYIDVEDKSTGKVWFAKDPKLNIDSRGWKNSGMASYYGNEDFAEGIILASESYDNKGKLISKSETKEINMNFPHSISIKGYSLRQMNLGQGER